MKGKNYGKKYGAVFLFRCFICVWQSFYYFIFGCDSKFDGCYLFSGYYDYLF